MTLDESVALSLLPALSRVGLTARLLAEDPALLDAAAGLLGLARTTRASATRRGIEVISWSDPRFPAGLLAIPDVPPVLWCRGSVAVFGAPAVAIVGSRAASSVALEIAARIGADLAAAGVTVVSGLARGVDSAAHRGALTTGRTIAVLGSGVDCVYPREHGDLAADIAAAGLVVSEYPPHTPPLAFRFPQRNRLISGLSRGVVVIEASDKSGSLITAACALEQGREVMVVPGNVLSGRNRGAHALIRDGARIVECADDVLEELHLNTRSAGTRAQAANTSPSSVSDDSLTQRMEAGEAYDLDGLAEMSGLDAPRLLPRLLTLEIEGRIRRVEGGRFVRSTRPC